MTLVGREHILRHRARVMHLDQKLPAGSFAAACPGRVAGLDTAVGRALAPRSRREYAT